MYITVYAVTRHYGGPEEGGWWYDWNHHVESSRKIKKRKAKATVKRLLKKHDHIREGDISSVLGGTEVVVYRETWPGQFTTRRRPRYE